MLRKLLQTADPASQPFVISGSGTLGWDMVAANLAERGEEVLVLHTGYFADSFADCFDTYGVKATQLKAPIGDRPQLPEVEKALKEKKYKLITVTHVDTSTGVLSEVKALSEMIHRVSPETLVVVDAVCAVGSEEICFDDWGLDVVLTASQKGVGCPPGLCIMMCSGRAIETFKNRKLPSASYYASFKNWLPSRLCPSHNARVEGVLISVDSNAKLRSQKAFLLRHTPNATCQRLTHLSYTNPLSATLGAFRSPPRSLPAHQESCHRNGAKAASREAREPGERHDGHLLTQ